ncbi:MAG: hypothetical protein K6G60_02200 [Lachnospiraceae bacterium]|nr:hypothetical protein [Lachnospiraceae bacterium]
MAEKIRDMLSDKGKRTLLELLTGVVVYDMAALAVGAFVLFFYKYNYHAYVPGILLGMSVAWFMVIHMYHVLEKAMLCDKKHAKNKTKLGALVRMFVMVGALIVSAVLPAYISMVGVMVGIFALKIAALTQPLIDKVFSKFVKKEE